ncbi:MAG: response regulator [Parasulfuritortus sp.]|nr:response regulator [Parasulfuritortus sp.]
MRLIHSNPSGHLATAGITASPEAATVFIVDDRATARSLLEGLAKSLGDEVAVECFADPRQALERAGSLIPDLIITDYRMPAMDGIEFTRRLRAIKALADIPIVIITVVEDRKVRHLALESGATDFLTRPIDPHECRARCRNLLALRRSQKKLSDRANRLEVQVARATQMIHSRERETLIKLAKAGEYRDENTGNHIYRMARFSSLIARKLGLNGQECEDIEVAAPMHDLGKIGIPDNILLKHGALTPQEWMIMKTHPVIGHDILADSPSHYLRLGALIALCHHERYDGKGYPHGLAGEAIPLSARIVTVADVFDALTTARPYKQAWTFEAALDYINEQKGTHFDPNCAQVFLDSTDEVRRIMREYQDEEDSAP